MTAKKILQELKSLGTESYKKLMFKNHGVKEPCFGVKIGDLLARSEKRPNAEPVRQGYSAVW